MANNSYFTDAIKGVKSLLIGMDITAGEFITPKVTEQYPENRKTQHIAERHRGTLQMVLNEEGAELCTACTMCEKICPNGSISIKSTMVTTPEGKKKKLLLDYQYDLGDCMFCQLCVNACNFNAIRFVKDFENSVFDRNSLIQHLVLREAPAPAPTAPTAQSTEPKAQSTEPVAQSTAPTAQSTESKTQSTAPTAQSTN